MRQQYALDTAAHLEVQRQRHVADTATALDALRRDLMIQHGQEAEQRLVEQEVTWRTRVEEAVAKQAEVDALNEAAKVVELVAEVKAADERRRKEKKELAAKLTEETRQLAESVHKERLVWTDTQREAESMSQSLRDAVDAERVAKEEAQREVDRVKTELAEVRKQQTAEATRSQKKLAAKHGRLQKEHTDLLAMHKQTTEVLREVRVQCGKLEVLKSDSEREVKDRAKNYNELAKLHDATTQELTGARREILALKAQIKEAAPQTLYEATQREVHTLHTMLHVSQIETKKVQEELARSQLEVECLRDSFDQTTQGALMRGLYEKSVAVLKGAKEEIEDLKARLAVANGSRSDREMVALKAMLRTANAELESMRNELTAVRAAYDKTDHGIHLNDAKKEIQKLHSVVAVLIQEIKDPKLVEQLVTVMVTQGVEAAAQAAQLAQSANKRMKKGK